jgi:hypothetical protein
MVKVNLSPLRATFAILPGMYIEQFNNCPFIHFESLFYDAFYFSSRQYLRVLLFSFESLL